MDRAQFQEMGPGVRQELWGILKESGRILSLYRRLFFSLASTLVLPLCFLLLAHHLVSLPLVHKISHDERYIEQHPGTPDAERRQANVAGEWVSLLAFFTGYLLFVLAFSLLSTAAVVYTVACIYTEKSVSYTKVLGVVPTVWKRLLITFLWVFFIIAAYHGISILIIHVIIHSFEHTPVFFICLFFILLVLISLQNYLSCIWHLASVISVLEDRYGFFALKRSFNLIKGKQLVGFELFSAYVVMGGVISILFHIYVLHHRHHDATGHNLLFRLVLGTLLVAFLTVVTLFGMLVQTVFYFVCKAYHGEQIDWTALSEQLGAYMGEYVPLKSSIQMETL